MKRGVLLITALLLAIYSIGFWGCTKEVEGPERVNQPPIVQFVNIPVAGSQFSSDTTIYWYGTDVDGFIRYFRYAVIESTVVGGDPLGFIYGNKADIDWTVLEVTLENPNSNSKVNMSADVKDPVRKYVSSYVFLQAIDNLGEESDVIYRMFRKNNHFPVTKINYYSLGSPFINAVSSDGILPGIQVQWSATDPVDYPRDAPPFEYRWKFYGPYDSLEMEYINDNYQQAYFVDDNGDYYLEGDTLALMVSADTAINTTVTPPETTITPIYDYYPIEVANQDLRRFDLGTWDTLTLGVYGEIDSTALPPDSLYRLNSLPLVNPDTFLVEESDGWLYDVERATIYNVFRKDPSHDSILSITRQRYFFFTCQARDDSKVPDNAPDFRWISVIEPKYERDVMLVDYSVYKPNQFFRNWPRAKWVGRDIYGQLWNEYYDGHLLKDVYGGLANGWKAGCFDVDSLLDDVDIEAAGSSINYNKYFATQDYYPAAMLRTFAGYGIGAFSLTDVLRHKIVLIVKDDATSAMEFSVGSEPSNGTICTSHIVSGLNAGMSVWSMLRGPFPASGANTLPFATYQNVPALYQEYFGIDAMIHTGWTGRISTGISPDIVVDRIESFVGGTVNDNPYVFTDAPETFNFAIDTALLHNRYAWVSSTEGSLPYPWYDSIAALPEVGYVRKDGTSKAIYEYVSKYGPEDEDRPAYVEKYAGTKVAIAKKTQVYRTMHYCFSLVAVDSISAQAIFNESMDWLSVQPFLQTGKMDKTADAQVSVQKLRSIQQEIEDNQRRIDVAKEFISEY